MDSTTMDSGRQQQTAYKALGIRADKYQSGDTAETEGSR